MIESLRSKAEFFVFALWSAIRGSAEEVELYATTTDGVLKRFETVAFNGGDDLPEHGAFSVETDRAAVKGLQEQIIGAFGPAVIRQKCAGEPKEVKLGEKMLRAEHVPVLAKLIEEGALAKCEELYLSANAIGDEGAKALAAALPSLGGLEVLLLNYNAIGDEGEAAVRAHKREGLKIFV